MLYHDFTKDTILNFLNNKEIDLAVLDETASTNTYLKNLITPIDNEGKIIIADRQTHGRGRFGREFHSPQGCGIYMSFLLRPTIPAEKAVLLTAAAAVAVSEACEALTGCNAQIKWVNDVFINSKKVCGILAEGALNPQTGMLDYVILGIGINAYEPLCGYPDALKDIAGAVFKVRESGLRSRLAAEIINRFFDYYNRLSNKAFIQEYRRRSLVIGKKINVISNDISISATALEIDNDCRLLVRFEDGTRKYLSSGEISIKLQ